MMCPECHMFNRHHAKCPYFAGAETERVPVPVVRCTCGSESTPGLEGCHAFHCDKHPDNRKQP